MGIEKGERFVQGDVFVDYNFEEVMFRWDKRTEKIYLKFYGEPEHRQPVPHENKLFNDALLYGEEISYQSYLQGKNKKGEVSSTVMKSLWLKGRVLLRKLFGR